MGLLYIVGWIRIDNKASIQMVEGLGWQRVGPLPQPNASVPRLDYYAYAVENPRKEIGGDFKDWQ